MVHKKRVCIRFIIYMSLVLRYKDQVPGNFIPFSAPLLQQNDVKFAYIECFSLIIEGKEEEEALCARR